MSPRVFSIREFNTWLAQVRLLATQHSLPIDGAELAWVGRFQRGLSPGQALEEQHPSAQQLDLFLPPLPL